MNVEMFAFVLAAIQPAISQSKLECFQLKEKDVYPSNHDSLGYSQMWLPGSSGNKRDPLSNEPSHGKPNGSLNVLIVQVTYICEDLCRLLFARYCLWVFLVTLTLQ